MPDIRRELESYAKKRLHEQEPAIRAQTINQIVEREWREYINRFAAQVDMEILSTDDAHRAIEALVNEFGIRIQKRWTEERGMRPLEPRASEELYREVPEELAEYAIPRGYLLTEIAGADRPRVIRMILARYWREIIEHGLPTFFMRHPEFGVYGLGTKLLNEFADQVHRRYISRRQAMSYDPDVMIPFELEMLTGLEGAVILTKDVLVSGVLNESFRDHLAGQFERYYFDQAYIRGSKYAEEELASEFVSGFCYWIVNNPAVPASEGAPSPPRHYYR